MKFFKLSKLFCGFVGLSILGSASFAEGFCTVKVEATETKVGGVFSERLYTYLTIRPDQRRCKEGCSGKIQYKLFISGKNGDVEILNPAGFVEWESNEGEEVEEVGEIIWPKCSKRPGDVRTIPCEIEKVFITGRICKPN